LARKGIEIERKARDVEIFSLTIKTIDLPQVCFKISCSKGTYIRTLGRDIGRKIGCGAHLLHLRRLQSGLFDLEQAIPWETLRQLFNGDDLSPWLIPLKEALPYFPEVVGDEQLVKKIRFGQEMVVGDLSDMVLPAFEKGQWLKMSSAEEGLVAILKSEFKGEDLSKTDPKKVAFRPLRIFHMKKQYPLEGHL
jgi:tRNA pseudouridine55 synthase